MTFTDADILAALPLDEQVRKWAIWAVRLDAVARGIEIEKFATELKKQGIAAPKKIINDALSSANKTDAASDAEECPVKDIEPWPEEVTGPDVWAELVSNIKRYIVIDQDAAHAVAAWVLFSHAIDLFDFAPLLLVESATPRCGKTRLLEMLRAVCPRAIHASSISAAALYRCIELWRPTILIDEADVIFQDNEGLRTVVNSGLGRGDGVLRCDGDKNVPRLFKTWCPKVFAMIQSSTVPASTRDRSIRIEMRRKTSDERVDALDRKAIPGLEILGRKIARLIADTKPEIMCAAAQVEPLKLESDRARDIWLPLAAVAVPCGSEAENAVRLAAVRLTQASADAESPDIKERLLADIVRCANGRDWISTPCLIDALCLDDAAPWATLTKGKPINANKLARLLRPFGVKPTKARRGDETVRGYDLAAREFAEARRRWLPGSCSPEHSPHPEHAKSPEQDRPTAAQVVAGVAAVAGSERVDGPVSVLLATPGTSRQTELVI